MLTPQYIADVLTLSLPELQAKYRQKSNPQKPTIKDARSHQMLVRKYGKQVKTMESSSPDSHERLNKISELLENAGIQPDDIGNIQSVRVGTYQMLTKNEDGEAEIHDLEVRNIQYKPRTSTEAFEPAKPAKITPSRRKPAVRDHKLLFVFGDAQIDYRRVIDSKTGETEMIPLHDERAIRIAQMICSELQPDTIINLGDTIDLSALSRFPADSDHFHKTIGPSFQRVHDMYAQLRSDNPKAEIVEVCSNHNARLRNYVLKNMPQFHDIRRPGVEEEYPVMTYPYLANLGHLSVKYISGYGEAAYVYGQEYGTPPIHFKHGNTAAPGSTAAKESKNYPNAHIVRGHSHRTDRVFTTIRHGEQAGKYLASIVVGTLCKITGEVPGVHSAVDDLNQPVHSYQAWQQSALLIRDYGGTYEFQDVMIQDGKAYLNGKEYDGNEN